MNYQKAIDTAAKRSGVGTNDGMFGDVGDRVNDALKELSDRNARGWDWLWVDVAVALTSGVAVYTFDTIARLLSLNAGVSPIDPVLYPVSRVQSVDLIPTQGGAVPVERASRREMVEYESTVSGYIALWTVEGQALRVAPAPLTGLYGMRLRVVVAEKALVAPTDTPLLPAQHDGAWMHLTRSLIYEQKQDDTRAAAARALYETQIKQVLAMVPYGGPGRPPLEGY